MRGFNRVILAGNLARDPDLRYTVSKKAYARLTVVVNNRYKDSNGEWKDSADYVPVVAWGTTAENCGKYLKKGSGVLVEGKLRTGSYEAKDGSGKKFTVEVCVDSMQFIGGSGQSGNSNNARSQSAPGGYTPTDEDFGKSIGESGFGVDNFPGGFANIPDGASENDIPF